MPAPPPPSSPPARARMRPRCWSPRQAAGAVCISTFTKALQRQLSRETEKLYPDAATHREKVVVRKGRENYLCLLNLEDALRGGGLGGGGGVGRGLRPPGG